MKKLLSIILSITMLLSSAIMVSADELFTTTTATEVTVEKTTEFVGKLKVGTNAEFVPFEYYENDELKGFDIELMNAIGDYIGYEIEYVNMDFDKLIPAVVSGEVDCAISAITVTEQRESAVDFTRPYLSASVIEYPMDTKAMERTEDYAIVFPENARAKSQTSIASGKDTLYGVVDNAIEELKKDATIDKLIDKYALDETMSDTNVEYSYYVLRTTTTDDADDTQNKKPSAFETIDTTEAIPVYLPSDWAAESVANAKNIGIIDSTKVYDYKKPISREEFCEIIYNYCANVVGMLETVDYESKFTDTDNTHITILNAMGIINGKSDTTFAPNDSLTREEAAVILERMVNKTVPVEVTEMYFEFDDSNDISKWADSSIQVMCNMGVMNGVGGNKFAPKEIYTTEQAIATVIRVYEAQTQHLRENIDLGIIGGADGPTSIIVGSNTNEQPIEIALGDDVAVDDFYIDEAIKLSTDAGKMAADKTFISMYVSKDVADEVYGKLDNIDYAKPKEMYYVSFNPDKVVEFYEELYAKEDIDAEIDIAKALEYQKFNLSVFANMINGRYGANTLAATSILTNRKGYVMPKDFKGDFGLYMVYEGEYSVLVTFSEIGENVIEGRMQYVKNGEKADILSFMNEVYSSFGEECITIGKVK